MLALHGAGQQAEALRCYHRVVRVRLRDELGIVPGAAIRDLHQQILCSDQPTAWLARSSVAAGGASCLQA
jgi:DNA-binding SARP family transcriptional activator